MTCEIVVDSVLFLDGEEKWSEEQQPHRNIVDIPPRLGVVAVVCELLVVVVSVTSAYVR